MEDETELPGGTQELFHSKSQKIAHAALSYFKKTRAGLAEMRAECFPILWLTQCITWDGKGLFDRCIKILFNE
ncbi:hypothetical protein scyTo_0006173 [Scyliorhinus torazame]|uniref:Uncharacterized protein n=1 Tax=Scyliorhinus torazame TaxID=75743 RepID=A0A401PG87_SCYTO|nr:hypothetical protein [Scyliorhinus torazame]